MQQMASLSKRKALLLAERVDIVNWLEASESHMSIAKSCGVHPIQISQIVKQKQLADFWWPAIQHHPSQKT